MTTLIVRWFLNALALMAVAWLYSGVKVESITAALMAALVLGLVNAVIRPLLVLLTLPEFWSLLLPSVEWRLAG